MTQQIIFQNDDGGVAVVTPSPEWLSQAGNTVEKLAEMRVPAGKAFAIVATADIPDDRDFRNAWELSNGAISVSMTKAKAITKDRLRAEREPLLAAQDVLYMRALETGGLLDGIVAEKQRLRDITQLADQATTLDELKAITVQGA
jgi:hypothetical protein